MLTHKNVGTTMNIISGRITSLSEFETLAMTRLNQVLKAQGFIIINLNLCEPYFRTEAS